MAFPPAWRLARPLIPARVRPRGGPSAAQIPVTVSDAVPARSGSGPVLVDDAHLPRLRRPEGDPLPPESALRGWIEHAGIEAGVGGWIADRHDAHARLELVLCAGARVLARRAADRPRADVWRDAPVDVVPGFLFEPECLAVAAASGAADDVRPCVRVAGSEFVVDGVELPTLGELRRALASASNANPSASVSRWSDPGGLPLAVALERLSTRAAAVAQGPLHAPDSSRAGFLELVAPLGDERAFVIGWCRDDVALEQPVVVAAGGRKHAGALVAVRFSRDDLPAGAHAFLGVLAAGWRPDGPQSLAHVFLGDGRDAWLRTHAPLRVVGPGDVQEPLRRLQATVEDAGAQARLAAFAALMDTPSQWGLTPDGGASVGVRVGLDAVTLLPGFGALVEGWAVVAGGQVAGLALRLGAATLEADRDARATQSRRDLATAFPALRDRLDDAGFRAVLRGPLAAGDVAAPRLSVTLDDGRRVVVPVPADALRRAGPGLEARTASRWRALLARESDARAFAHALAAQGRAQALAGLRELQAARGTGLLAWALPEDPSDAVHALAALARHANALPASAALVVVATPRHDAKRVRAWLAAARAAGGPALGWWRVDEARGARHALPDIARACGAARWVYLGPGRVPLPEGWGAIARHLAGDDDGDGGDGAKRWPVRAWHHGRETVVSDPETLAGTGLPPQHDDAGQDVGWPARVDGTGPVARCLDAWTPPAEAEA